ncbi:MAG: antibiotic acetyltransferase [Actinobacteria bacterium]|nr:antibiotic acetyltransferase [Actinomycetota bacterium]
MSHVDYKLVTTTKLDDISIFVHGKGNKNSYSRGDIIIGDDVYIGANVTIMDNVKIGNGAYIGACTVITKDVPPYAIVCGNPGKVIKYRFTQEQIEKLEKIEWWNRPDVNIGDLFSHNIDKFIEKYSNNIDIQC